mgnify:CR=1 FL=1
MTTLYNKTQKNTGLKYFGKTVKNETYEEIHKYTGSGVKWKNHLKKHGKEYFTEIYAQIEDSDSWILEDVSLSFSKENNIVESSEWANLIEENGKDGGVKGSIQSESHRKKLIQSREKKKYFEGELVSVNEIAGIRMSRTRKQTFLDKDGNETNSYKEMGKYLSEFYTEMIIVDGDFISRGEQHGKKVSKTKNSEEWKSSAGVKSSLKRVETKKSSFIDYKGECMNMAKYSSIKAAEYMENTYIEGTTETIKESRLRRMKETKRKYSDKYNIKNEEDIIIYRNLIKSDLPTASLFNTNREKRAGESKSSYNRMIKNGFKEFIGCYIEKVENENKENH